MVKVLYHDKCFDGFTAAWVAWKRFGASAEYIPVSYGQTPYEGSTDQDDVYLLDFCYPAQVLRTLPAHRLVILDHHKTAEADLALFKPKFSDEIIFDMNRSGAGMAWDYFFMEPRPKLVDYAEDHDLWRYELRASREIRAYMHSVPKNWLSWGWLSDELDHDWNICVDKGRAIQGFIDQQVAMICDNAIIEKIGGIAVPVVNATTLFSEVGEELNRRHPMHHFAAYWLIQGDGRKKWGLRANPKYPDFDVSEIAQLFGGGGHKAAAGWVAPNGD